jgi:transposase
MIPTENQRPLASVASPCVLQECAAGRIPFHAAWVQTASAWTFLDEQIEALSTAIAARLTALSANETAPLTADGAVADNSPAAAESLPALTFVHAVELLDTIPGVDRRGAELILAEIGIDMIRFGTVSPLAAWAGLAPGNNESAGKQWSSTTRKGNEALRAGLTPLAQAAARTKETYLLALYGRLAARRGSNARSWRLPTPSWSVSFTCSRARSRITSWERATTTNDGGIIRLIDWPSGVSGSAIRYTLNL